MACSDVQQSRTSISEPISMMGRTLKWGYDPNLLLDQRPVIRTTLYVWKIMKSIIVGTDLEIQHFDTPKMKQYRVRLQLGHLVTSWWWPMGPSCKFLMDNVFIPNCWKRQVGMVGTLKNYCSSTIYIYRYHNRLLMVYPCNWWWTCYWETIFPGCRCGTGWKLSQSSLSWPMWPLPQQGWGPGDQYLSR